MYILFSKETSFLVKILFFSTFFAKTIVISEKSAIFAPQF